MHIICANRHARSAYKNGPTASTYQNRYVLQKEGDRLGSRHYKPESQRQKAALTATHLNFLGAGCDLCASPVSNVFDNSKHKFDKQKYVRNKVLSTPDYWQLDQLYGSAQACEYSTRAPCGWRRHQGTAKAPTQLHHCERVRRAVNNQQSAHRVPTIHTYKRLMLLLPHLPNHSKLSSALAT